jgi:hypothetical protein
LKYATLRTKGFKIAALTNQVKELRSEFVDRRSQLMKLDKVHCFKKMIEKDLSFNSTSDKIKVKKEEEKSFLKKLWQ